MSTITRELAKLFRKITNSEIDAEGNAHVVLSPADSLLINNARIALASLEDEIKLLPVGVMSESAFYRLERSESRFIALWPRPGIFCRARVQMMALSFMQRLRGRDG